MAATARLSKGSYAHCHDPVHLPAAGPCALRGPQELAARTNAVVRLVLQTGERPLATAPGAFADAFDRARARLDLTE